MAYYFRKPYRKQKYKNRKMFQSRRGINNATNFSDFHSVLRNVISNYSKEIRKKKCIKNDWANEELITFIGRRDKFYKLMKKHENN